MPHAPRSPAAAERVRLGVVFGLTLVQFEEAPHA